MMGEKHVQELKELVVLFLDCELDMWTRIEMMVEGGHRLCWDGSTRIIHIRNASRNREVG